MTTIINFLRWAKKTTSSSSHVTTAIHNTVRRLRRVNGLEPEHGNMRCMSKRPAVGRMQSVDTSTESDRGRERGLSKRNPLSLSGSDSDSGFATSTRGTICLDCGALVIPYSDSDPTQGHPAFYLPRLHLQTSGSTILEFRCPPPANKPASTLIGMRNTGDWVFASLFASRTCDELELEHVMADLGMFTWLSKVKECPSYEQEFLVERVDGGEGWRKLFEMIGMGVASVVSSRESAGTISSSSSMQTEPADYIDGESLSRQTHLASSSLTSDSSADIPQQSKPDTAHSSIEPIAVAASKPALEDEDYPVRQTPPSLDDPPLRSRFISNRQAAWHREQKGV